MNEGGGRLRYFIHHYAFAPAEQNCKMLFLSLSLLSVGMIIPFNASLQRVSLSCLGSLTSCPAHPGLEYTNPAQGTQLDNDFVRIGKPPHMSFGVVLVCHKVPSLDMQALSTLCPKSTPVFLQPSVQDRRTQEDPVSW